MKYPDFPGERDPLDAAAEALFGLAYLFPYQRLVISNLLEAAEAAGIPIRWSGKPSPAEKTPDQDRETQGRQIVILPTGAGKSLCFQVPALLFQGPTLVIYPILSLMADQERRLKERGFLPVVLRGGQTREERTLLWEQIHSGKSPFIIANPEVLLTPQVLGKLETLGIVHIVIDEAHCVSEWGERFRPSYLEIPRIIAAVQAPLVTAFTATASQGVLEKIDAAIFGGQGAHRIIGNPDRSNISYGAVGCILRDLAVRDLLRKNLRPALVFCSSRVGTEGLARYLRNELQDREIRFYHAGLSREEKTAVEQWFLKHPRGILTATCAYGMGVDKGDLRTVIHRDCPPSVEAYLQESGRAGRDGLPAQAILLWGPEDPGILQRTQAEADRIRRAKLFSYTRNNTQCRRAALLGLLDYEGTGESPPSQCCDVCEGTGSKNLREEAGLIRFFTQNPRRYTVTGAAAQLSQLEPFNCSEEEAEKAINQLLKDKILKRKDRFLWKGTLSVS